jgi:hypothetical protein
MTQTEITAKVLRCAGAALGAPRAAGVASAMLDGDAAASLDPFRQAS